MSWREFRFLRKGKAALVWKIRNDGESYITESGQLNGKMQVFSDSPGDKGKFGTFIEKGCSTFCEGFKLR